MVSQERERVASMLGEKRWQLRGEVSSRERPVNSLLEEPVLFDQSRAPRALPTLAYLSSDSDSDSQTRVPACNYKSFTLSLRTGTCTYERHG